MKKSLMSDARASSVIKDLSSCLYVSYKQDNVLFVRTWKENTVIYHGAKLLGALTSKAAQRNGSLETLLCL